MRIQTIIIEVAIEPEQPAYLLGEDRPGSAPYRALEHFFTDIGYEVRSISSTVRDAD